jgi:hypothetical protein
MPSIFRKLLHERVFKIRIGNESFLYCPRTYPPYQVQMATGLVVGAGAPGTAKWLLSHHCPGWFIIYIEVAC